MSRTRFCSLIVAGLAIPALAGRLTAQGGEGIAVAANGSGMLAAPDSVVYGPRRTPISIGNYPVVDGLRLNFRDRDYVLVRGANVTVWFPKKRIEGSIHGLALGLPATGGGTIRGIALAPVGVRATNDLRGITLGGLGAGAGGKVSGIAVGGLGLAAGGALNGLMVGGLGVASGGSAHGIVIGGLGAATGGDLRGIVVGGLGAGVARDMTGIAVGGLGVGAAGHIKGLIIGGIGSGSGGNVTGIALSGIGTGVGGTFTGIGASGIAIGATGLHGVFLAPAVGTKTGRGLVIAPALFRVQPDGNFRGIAVSSVNYLRGSQRGLTIGLFNYARSLRGVQLGVINVVSSSRHKVLPLINWGNDTMN